MLPRVTIVALAMLLFVACGGGAEQATPTSSGQSPDTTPTRITMPDATPTVSATTPTTETDAGVTPTAVVAFDFPELTWTLVSLNNETIDAATTITLSFKEGRATGNAGCNDYNGAYSASVENDISISEIAITEQGCQEPVGIMDLERSYVDALGNVSSYVLNDDRLELVNASGETTLVFTRSEQAALDGTFWSVVTLDGGYLIAETYITIAFSDGKIAGSAGCNALFGEYNAESDGSLTFTEIGSTAMECSEPADIVDQEFALINALQEITSYKWDLATNTLFLINDAGQTRIELFGTEEPTGGGFLDNSGWVLTETNGQQADSGFPITLMIRDSQLSGEAGCRTYTGDFTTDAEGSISDLTLYPYDAACVTDDVDERAIAYLATLQTVTHYLITSDRLEFLIDNGETVLVYRLGVLDSGLERTEWTLLTMNGSAPIEGTTITLSFGDGVGGVGGCNEYGGDYVVVEHGVISMPGLSHTDMGCPEPEGTQEQETAYIETLHQIVAYELTDSTLGLMNAAGETTLVFERGRQ